MSDADDVLAVGLGVVVAGEPDETDACASDGDAVTLPCTFALPPPPPPLRFKFNTTNIPLNPSSTLEPLYVPGVFTALLDPLDPLDPDAIGSGTDARSSITR